MFDLNAFVVRTIIVAMSTSALACSGDPISARKPSDLAGASGTGGMAGASAGGGGGSGATGGSSAGGSAGTAGTGVSGLGGVSAGHDPLTAHIEDDQTLVVELVTVACPGECVEVKAVARGGRPDYHFVWEDGSTDQTRMLCPSEDSTHEVTVTDTARENEEFAHEMQTARASVDTDVLDCTPPIDPPDAGPNDECATDDDCAAGQACFEGICVGEGGLRFSLTWNEDTDFDLFVRMPDGRTEISFVAPAAGGGMLDVDDCFESCRIPGGPHVENIFFMADPPRGTYTYWVVNSGLVNPDDFSIEVSAAGAVQATQAGSLAAFDGTSPRYTFEY